MAIEALANITRGGVGAFGLSGRTVVSASRDLTPADIGQTLVITAAVTLTVPSTLGAAGDVIYIKRIGATAALTLVQGSGATLYDLSGGVALPDHGMTMLDCEAPGVWTRQS